jgi:proline iminopeptidase
LPREGIIPVNNTGLYFRDIGQGPPVIILHGGPDFDHTYLLPQLDLLSDSLRLIYYAQRGRGKSASSVQPEEVSIASEINDLEAVRGYFRLESCVVLGHSWGGLLAMEYALRHPQRISHLILMNTAPASHDDYLLFRQERLIRQEGDAEALEKISSSASYTQGDPDAVAEYYRIHYKAALKRPELLESLIASLRASFTREGILKGRAIEDRLMDETWLSGDYNLLPRLARLDLPALIIHGDYDFVPVECAARIAQAIPGARFVVLKDTGHFSYLESPVEVRKIIGAFLQRH